MIMICAGCTEFNKRCTNQNSIPPCDGQQCNDDKIEERVQKDSKIFIIGVNDHDLCCLY